MTQSDRDLAAALSGLHREINVLYSVIARRSGLTLQQATLLCSVAGQRPSFGELAVLLGCDKTNITGMVDRLARRGLLAREPDPADRRVIRVVITEQGRSVGEDIRDAFAKELVARLPRSGRRELAATVETVVAALHAG